MRASASHLAVNVGGRKLAAKEALAASVSRKIVHHESGD